MTSKEAGEPRVRRRAAFYVAGYDPRRPEFYHKLFTRELAAAAELRGFRARSGPLEDAESMTPFTVLETEGEHADGAWATRTTLTILRWDDLARTAIRLPLTPARLCTLLAVGVDLFRRGVLYRLSRVDRNFALFVAYPYVMTLLLTAVVPAVGLGVALTVGVAAAVAAVLAGSGASIATAWLVRKLDRPLYLRYLLEDWLLSLAHERGETDLLDSRLALFAQAISAATMDPTNDEVLLVGHSSGSFLAPEALAVASDHDPDLARRGPLVSLLTIGTVAPLMLVDERADRYRDAVTRLADERNIVWHEVQSRQDVMNVCPVDPPALTGRFSARTPWPKTMRLAMSSMVRPGQLGMFRERLFFFRNHFRFIRANERVSWYDFYGVLTGPRTLAQTHAEVEDLRDALKRARG